MDDSGRRMQVRLGDLGVAVIGSAYVFDVTRRSMVGWVGGVPDRAHLVALGVLAFGVGLGLILLGQGIRGVRGRRWWGASWRFVALGGPAALDLVVTDRLALGRFLGWWMSLWVMMLASLPVVAVAAVTLTHHVVRWVAK